ncbi:hypothetical protein BO94DRAFT_241845 [Aspergillus sclerotioniger CBS 115572]|uniref:Uncharacterized protein n=1 Tax=Aspergillus sclerotioniger CBS 115572 TaxID=1450535 RepID=A0A317VFP8_9EURO|nr:hypothetical protein BO94DRAFT_241845 [Aspergillus sclerotioniger CBS 115572]PWY73166.1 hypothetical protein BO94DRAFT_241845 [Aspergillus sclerotioniger CBS 115572]
MHIAHNMYMDTPSLQYALLQSVSRTPYPSEASAAVSVRHSATSTVLGYTCENSSVRSRTISIRLVISGGLHAYLGMCVGEADVRKIAMQGAYPNISSNVITIGNYALLGSAFDLVSGPVVFQISQHIHVVLTVPAIGSKTITGVYVRHVTSASPTYWSDIQACSTPPTYIQFYAWSSWSLSIP